MMLQYNISTVKFIHYVSPGIVMTYINYNNLLAEVNCTPK
jgi:hypothetical protein